MKYLDSQQTSLLGFISRPSNQVKRDTLNNILSTGYYTINSIHEHMIDGAHQTSGKYSSSISEFNECGFHPKNIDNFLAPFVKSSRVQIGMRFIESIPIKYNNTCLIVGEIELIHCKDKSLHDNFKDGIGVVGLN